MNSKITNFSKILDNYPGSTIKECDKSARNMNVVNGKSMEQTMSEAIYKQLETECKGYKVIIEFPDKPDNETVIHEEVKQILSNLLQEQIFKIS